jgi:hypothetical protein
MINPFSLLNPNQMDTLQKIQQVSRNIKVEMATSDRELTLKFVTEDSQAAELIPSIQEALVTSIANTLYQMFNIGGERV